MKVKQLFSIMNIKLNHFDNFEIPRWGHSYLEPKVFFKEVEEVKGIPQNTQCVTEGKWKSGEIWKDTFYGIYYLYVGRTFKKNVDVVIILGGDTLYAGSVDKGVISSGDNGRIFFHKKIFPK